MSEVLQPDVQAAIGITTWEFLFEDHDTTNPASHIALLVGEKGVLLTKLD
jgi:hypothetical protein